MASYKLIQDIEAEDHIIGPLSLRQFIYALIAAFSLYMCYLGLFKRFYILLILFLPILIFFAFLAFPWGRDQPTEVWALAKMRFLFKPRRRIWDQNGVKELVKITAPKRVERELTDGLTQTEVKSRLKALAKTLDSRGWAVKGIDLNLYTPQNAALVSSNDRLLDLGSLPQNVPEVDTLPSDDVFAEVNSTAQKFNDMIDESAKTRRQSLISQMNSSTSTVSPASANDNFWFMSPVASTTNRPGKVYVDAPQVTAPSKVEEATRPLSPEEENLVKALKDKSTASQISMSNLRTITPGGGPVTPSSQTPDPAILSLANNDDLNVTTIAKEANKARHKPSQNEVVIDLHS